MLAVDPGFIGVWNTLEGGNLILEVLPSGVVGVRGVSWVSAMVARTNR